MVTEISTDLKAINSFGHVSMNGIYLQHENEVEKKEEAKEKEEVLIDITNKRPPPFLQRQITPNSIFLNKSQLEVNSIIEVSYFYFNLHFFQQRKNKVNLFFKITSINNKSV